MMKIIILSTVCLAFSISTVESMRGVASDGPQQDGPQQDGPQQDGPGDGPNSDTGCKQYDWVVNDYKCPADEGRLDRELDKTKEECYELCHGNPDCAFFTYGEEDGPEFEFSGLCITCIRDTGASPKHHPYDGFKHYIMLDTDCTVGEESSESSDEVVCDDGSDEPYVYVAEDAKCPYQNEERLWRSDDYAQMTLQDCYEKCRITENCRYFTYGANHPEGHMWEGLCILCTENAESANHDGFVHYWMNDQCEINGEVYEGGGGKESPAPTPSPTTTTGGVRGDPHFKTWDGQLYDFHGLCDLVLLHTPDFMNGLGMDIHIRSTRTREWSYISRAVVKIGSDTFELSTSRDRNDVTIEYFINGISGKNDNLLEDNMKLPNTISGFEIQYRSVNSQQKEYIIDLGDGEMLSLLTWKYMIRIDLQGCKAKNFASSVGLMGTFTNSHKVGRDNSTIIENLNEFGQEWQVLHGEGMLFQTVEGPQAPSKCEIPSKSQLRRHLSQSEVTLEEAELACARVKDKDDFNLCVFDIMVTNDVESVGVY